MPRKRLLVTGATGFLGATVVLEAAKSNWDVVTQVHTHEMRIDRAQPVNADLSSIGSGKRLIEQVQPDAVINCAALANVDDCETNKQLATRLNADLVGELAGTCNSRGTRFVHVSTDAVFGGTPPPYFADTDPAPLNTYGTTKMAGEKQALVMFPGCTVARTNIIGWSPSGTRSLLEFFFTRLKDSVITPGFDDVLFRPATTPQVARQLLALAANTVFGNIHLTGDTLLSKFAFGQLVASTFGFDIELVQPMSIADGAPVARRANNLDVRPSSDVLIGPLAINLEKGMIELRDLRQHGFCEDLYNAVSRVTP